MNDRMLVVCPGLHSSDAHLSISFCPGKAILEPYNDLQRRSSSCVMSKGVRGTHCMPVCEVVHTSDECQHANLANTCCSVALPACCTAALSSGVGLDCPELKCCSNKLICAWLGFHLGLYAIHHLSEPDQVASRDSDIRARLTLVLLPNAALAVGIGLASCECRFREGQTSRYMWSDHRCVVATRGAGDAAADAAAQMLAAESGQSDVGPLGD